MTALRSKAVAIDPPPDGAIGIRELLERFERFAQADELVTPPENGAVGIKALLDRLGGLAKTGYFTAGKDGDSEDR